MIGGRRVSEQEEITAGERNSNDGSYLREEDADVSKERR
jgi:hypothetical protein